MASTTPSYFERESNQIVEEFLRNDFLPPEVAEEVERLHEENRTTDALDVILAERQPVDRKPVQ